MNEKVINEVKKKKFAFKNEEKSENQRISTRALNFSFSKRSFNDYSYQTGAENSGFKEFKNKKNSTRGRIILLIVFLLLSESKEHGYVNCY